MQHSEESLVLVDLKVMEQGRLSSDFLAHQSKPRNMSIIKESDGEEHD